MRLPSAILVTLAATPAAALDTCLIGSWTADGADMASVIGQQMNATATHIGGQSTVMVDAAGTISLLSSDMTYKIQAPEMPEMEVTINGTSTGTLTTEGTGAFTANLSIASMTAVANFLGQTMEVPFEAVVGMTGGSYSCEGAKATFEPLDQGSFPRIWSK